MGLYELQPHETAIQQKVPLHDYGYDHLQAQNLHKKVGHRVRANAACLPASAESVPFITTSSP